MLSTNTLKYLRSLHQRKFRQKYNKFIVEGTKIANEVLETAPNWISGIYALPDWIETNEPLLSIHQSHTYPISPKELSRISTLKNPHQVLLELDFPHQTPDFECLQQELSLYLDGIQDPGNLGTILRIADWFGITQVFASEQSAAWDNPKVLQASMGAFLRVKYYRINIQKILEEENKLQLIGSVMDGVNIFEAGLSPKGVLILGQESQGISAATKAILTHRVSLPRPSGGGAESLNVGVACGLLCGALVYRNKK